MTVARELLGKVIELGPCAGRIVETEAYLDSNAGGEPDLAAHSSRGFTPRTRPIFGEPGHAYVYLIYGMYDCLNIVTEPAGKPGCVLIRALEPLRGASLMRQRRPGIRNDAALASGPGKLTRAFGITRAAHNEADLTAGPLLVTGQDARPVPPADIAIGPRIGIRHCADWPLRFAIRGHACISVPFPSTPLA